jgi:hypothetical protein
MAGVTSSSSSRFAFHNGTKGAENTGTRAPTLTTTEVGRLNLNGGTYASFRGDLAEVAIWTAALSDAEIASLAKGFSPLRVRPQSLVYYQPLVRSDHVWKGPTMPRTGSPGVTRHPRTYR